MKKITDILIWSGAFVALFALLGFANVMHDKEVCKQVIIKVDQSYENHFVNNEDIELLVHNKNGVIKGKQLREVDTQNIEAHIQGNPYVKNTEVYKTVNGKVNIRVVQRKPMARILTLDNASFYLDEDRNLIPLSMKYTARVMLINGNITTKQVNNSFNHKKIILEGSQMDDLFRLAAKINENEFFKAQIEQIYINKDKEYEFVPKVGRHIILFGKINKMDDKFEKLELFYKKGLKQVGWDKYKIVNLKYENQIVCTKK